MDNWMRRAQRWNQRQSERVPRDLAGKFMGNQPVQWSKLFSPKWWMGSTDPQSGHQSGGRWPFSDPTDPLHAAARMIHRFPGNAIRGMRRGAGGLKDTIAGHLETLKFGAMDAMSAADKGLGGAVSPVAGAIGGVLGKFVKFLGPLGAVIAGFFALHKVVGLLTEGVKHGAEAFQRAARMGGKIGAHAQVEAAFKSIGLEGMDISELQGQFNPRAKKFNVPDSDMILGAARAGQFGNMQQLTNMAEEFKEAMAAAKVSSEQLAFSAKATQVLSTQGSIISTEWKTMLSQLAAACYPLINLFEILAHGVLSLVNTFLKGINDIEQLLHLQPTTLDNFKQMGGSMGKSGPSFTSWEKMGFNFGQSANGPLDKIAINTRETVSAIKNLAKEIRSGGIPAYNVIGGLGPIPSTA
jgi:hypothetical protein